MAEQKISDKDRAIRSYVFDKIAIDSLNKLIETGCIAEVGGIIKAGKESRIILLKGKDERTLAGKIYMIETSSFTRMMQYIAGDYRFAKVGKTKRKIVNTWCKKEMRNLKKAFEAGVDVPRPVCSLNNVLVMELIEEDNKLAPQLSETTVANPQEFFDEVKSMMKKLYQAELVHADLSQYNILVRKGKPVFIDMGQSVLRDHPKAEEFLARDVKNIVKYFKSLGAECSESELLDFIKKA